MPAKPSGKEKTYTVRQKRPNGDVYLIERKTIYDQNAKKNVVLESRLVGKIPKGGTEIIRTRPRRASSRQAEADPEEIVAERQHTGMMDILRYVGEESGIDALLYRSTDRGTAEKIISLARYLVAEDHPTLPGIAIFQLSHPLPYHEGLSEDIYHQLFDEIGRDESLRQNFFRGRCRKLENRAALAYDSTAIGTYSFDQPDARWNAKGGTDLRVIKLLVLYAVETRQPIAYTKLPGNITDVVTIRTALKQLSALELGGATIIADNGYYSQENVAEMCLSGFRFLMPVKTSLKWIRNAIDSAADDLKSMNSIDPSDSQMHGVTIGVMHDFMRPRRYASAAKDLKKGHPEAIRRRVYVHIFYSDERKLEQDSAFNAGLFEIRSMLLNGTPLDDMSDAMKKRAQKYLTIRKKRGGLSIDYNHEACADARRYNGYVAFISNYKMEPFEALHTYRRRNTIELFFEVFKQQVDGNRPRVWTPERLFGRMFVQFVALCYYEYLAARIRAVMDELMTPDPDREVTEQDKQLEKKLLSWLSNNPLQIILRWFDTVDTVTLSTIRGRKRWSTETTKRDRLFLSMLGVRG